MRWFLLAMVLANIAGTMSRLLMPIYLTELGASVGQVGLVFTLASVVILALQVLGGWISDNIGSVGGVAIMPPIPLSSISASPLLKICRTRI